MRFREKVLGAALLVALALVLTLAFRPEPANTTGTLSIPNVIGAQAGPNIAASLFDTNWNTIRDYVNAREVALDALSARPAAGTSGRWFCSNDSGQVGACYVDTGSTWVQVSVASPVGVNSVRFLRGTPGDSGGANVQTQYSVTAEFVTTRNPQTGALTTTRASSTLTNNTATAGPAANGRDRSAAFSDGNRFVHLYYISGPGQSLATLSSTCSHANVGGGDCSIHGGPTLPTGYDSWAYIAPIQWGGTGFLQMDVRGNETCYRVASQTLWSGAATSPTAVSYASQAPTNVLGAQFNAILQGTAATTGTATVSLTNGTWLMTLAGRTTGGGTTTPDTDHVWIPNSSQQFFYNVSAADLRFTMLLQCYKVSNGGD